MKAKKNGVTQHRGLSIEHSADGVFVWRTLNPEKSASLQFADSEGCFSDDIETEMTCAEKGAIGEIVDAYISADLY